MFFREKNRKEDKTLRFFFVYLLAVIEKEVVLHTKYDAVNIGANRKNKTVLEIIKIKS